MLFAARLLRYNPWALLNSMPLLQCDGENLEIGGTGARFGGLASKGESCTTD